MGGGGILRIGRTLEGTTGVVRGVSGGAWSWRSWGRDHTKVRGSGRGEREGSVRLADGYLEVRCFSGVLMEAIQR